MIKVFLFKIFKDICIKNLEINNKKRFNMLGIKK